MTKVVVKVVVGVLGVGRFEGLEDPKTAATGLNESIYAFLEGFDCPKAVLEVWRISTVAANEGNWQAD